MTFNEKKEYLKGYKASLNLLRRLESRERFFALNEEEKKQREKAQIQNEKIREEITLIPDPVFREILFCKYVNGATLEELAEDFGYSTRHVQRLHKVAVENFETI